MGIIIIARIPIGDSPRVHPNIFKMSPPFASSEGVSASGVRYQSDGECVTHLLPHTIKIIIGSVGRREGSMNKQVCILKLIFT